MPACWSGLGLTSVFCPYDIIALYLATWSVNVVNKVSDFEPVLRGRPSEKTGSSQPEGDKERLAAATLGGWLVHTTSTLPCWLSRMSPLKRGF